jgi:hypothetical protein
MYSVEWQETETPLNVLIPQRRSAGPDYAKLVEVLTTLRQYLDSESGETVLTSEEAARIRACGFAARAGLWRCPLLPDHLVCFRPGLFLLSDRYGPETRGNRWHPKRAAVLPVVTPPDPVWSHEKGILDLLEMQPNHRLTRRQLQQRVSRRFPTWYLDRMLEHLVALDIITVDSGSIYPYSHAEFDARQRQAHEPRRLVPVYAK